MMEGIGMDEQKDFEIQIRRSLVPVAAGVIVARAARYGFDIPMDALVGILEAVAIGIWYLTLAFLEKKIPWVGALLGAIARPTYPSEEATMDRGEHDGDS